MRVDGATSFSSPYTRFGFSPQAIFSPYGAPGNFIPCVVRAGTFFNTTERPPNRFAEPGRICSVVTPPLIKAREKPGSCGQTLCSAHTSGRVGEVASLPSELESVPGEG